MLKIKKGSQVLIVSQCAYKDTFKKLCEELMYKLKFMPKIADFDRKNGYSTLEGRIYTKEFLESLYDIGGN